MFVSLSVNCWRDKFCVNNLFQVLIYESDFIFILVLGCNE